MAGPWDVVGEEETPRRKKASGWDVVEERGQPLDPDSAAVASMLGPEGLGQPAPQRTFLERVGDIGSRLGDSFQQGAASMLQGPLRAGADFIDETVQAPLRRTFDALGLGGIIDDPLGAAAVGEQAAAVGDLIAQDRAATLAATGGRPESFADALADPLGAFDYYGNVGAQSAAPMIAAIATRNPRLAAATVGVPTGGQVYDEARREGQGFVPALTEGVTAGGLETALGVLPFELAGTAGRRALSIPLEGVSEAATEVAQANVGDVLRDRETPVMEQLGQALDAFIVGSGLQAVPAVAGEVRARADARGTAPAAPDAPPSTAIDPTPAPTGLGDLDELLLRNLPPEVVQAVAPSPAPAAAPSPAGTSDSTDARPQAQVLPDELAARMRMQAQERAARVPVSAPVATPAASTADSTPAPEQQTAMGAPAPIVQPSVPVAGSRRADGDLATDDVLALKQEIGWEEIGGRLIRGGPIGELDQGASAGRPIGDAIGRTKWVGKVGANGRESTFWRGRPVKLNEKQAEAALDKWARGEKLGSREQQFVDYAQDFARGYAEEQEVDRQEAAAYEAWLAEQAPETQDEDNTAEANEVASLVARAQAAGFDAFDTTPFDFETGEEYATRLRAMLEPQDNADFDRLFDEAPQGDLQRGAESAQAPDAEGFALQAEQPRAEAPREVAPSAGLFGAPTTRDFIDNAQRSRDAARNGQAGSGRTDMLAGDGELFAGRRPAQDALESVEDAPFFSGALRAVEQGRGAPKRADATAWKGWFDGAVRRGDMKQSERDWLGIDDFLARNPQTTRDELADFVRANEVQVQDVVLGEGEELPAGWEARRSADGDGYVVLDPVGNERGYGPTREEAVRDAQDSDFRQPNNTKFSSYQLPGGANYRELLLTLPSDKATEGDAAARHYEIFVRRGGEPAWSELSPARREQIIRDMPQEARKAPAKPEFRSSHFDQPNVLAHVRFNERTDADGKRVLFLEEIQSDWHQAGRKRGYQGRGVDPLAAEAQRSFDESAARGENAADWRARHPEYVAALQTTFNQSDTVPDAPFKATDEWAMLAFKRMVRWAAENGFERVAWTTGAQQAERYDLSKQIASVAWQPTTAGRGTLIAIHKDANRDPVIEKEMGEGEVSDYIGKDVAERLLASRDRGGYKELNGLDLKVGGEGMRAFYDKILPTAVNKWAKRFGGRVGATTIKHGAVVVNDDFIDLNLGTSAKVHSLDLTEAMRDAALAGQPLFQQEADELADTELTDAERESFRRQNPVAGLTPAERNARDIIRADASRVNGERDADANGLRDAVSKAVGEAPVQVRYLRGVEGLRGAASPAYIERLQDQQRTRRGTKTVGLYVPASEATDGDAFAVIFTNAAKDPAQAAFTAAHEIAGHHGLRALLGDKLNPALEIADQNPTVKAVADAMTRQRKLRPDQRMLAVEEALADLAGASRTGNWQKIADKHGVTVSATMRSRVLAAIDNFLRRLKALFNRQGQAFTDAQVRDLLDVAWQAAKGENTGSMVRADGTLESDEALESVEYTPAQEAALTKAGLPVDRRSTVQRIRDGLREEWGKVRDAARDSDALKQATFDRFHGLRAAEAELALSPEQSPYLAARMTAGVSSNMEGLMLYGAPEWDGGILALKDGTKGLLDALKPVQGNLDQWLGWMVGRRAKLLKAQGREHNLSDADIDALLSLADGREQAFAEAARDYLTIKNAVLDVAEQAGLIDPAGRAAWDHAEYIPFYRAEGDGAAGPGTRRGLAGQSSGIRTLKGGENALADPLANIVRNFSKLIDASLKNRAVLLAVDQLGAKVFTPAAREVQPATIPLDQVKRHLREQGVPDSTIDGMPPQALKGVQRMLSIVPPSGDDVVRVMRDGAAEYYTVLDPLVLRSLTAFKEPVKNMAIKPFIWFKRLLTTGVTTTAEFVGANFIRDSGSAWIISDDRFIPGWDSLRGVGNTLRNDQATREMMMAGSTFLGGNFYDGNSDQAAAALRRALRTKGMSSGDIEGFMGTVARSPLHLWDAWLRLSGAVENANRRAVYEAALKAGRSKTEAAFAARDLMDFSMQGDAAWVQFFADVLPFFNARLQGLYKLGRRAGTKQGRRAILLRGSVMVLASTALYAWNVLSHGDAWDELEEWDKDAYWHIAPGTEYHVRIPKPFELGILFGTAPERAIAAVRHAMTGAGDRASDTWDSLVRAITGTLAFNPVPQAALPLAEEWANKRFFTGRPIENMGDENLLPEARADWHTSDTMKALGRLSGLSPKRLEHLWLGYTAGLGGYVLDSADAVTRFLTDAPERPAMRTGELPVIGRFLRGGSPGRSKYTERFYDALREAEQVEQTVKDLWVKGDQAAAEELQAEHEAILGKRVPSKRAKAGFLYERPKRLRKVQSELGKLRDKIEAIALSEYSASEKRDRIDALEAERNRMVKRAVSEE